MSQIIILNVVDCVDPSKLWKILKEMGLPDHLTCLLRHLYASQEATVNQTWNNGLVPNWERSTSSCILSACLLSLYAEHTMQNDGLDEAQAGIKIAGRNINNLRYANNTTLTAESQEELKSLLIKLKEESGKSWLKTQHSKN